MDRLFEGHGAGIGSDPNRTIPPTLPDGSPAGEGVTVYGADWCGDTRRAKALLERHGVDYAWVDVDLDPRANDWAATQNGGERRIPVVVLDEQTTLIEPSDDALQGALRIAGLVGERVDGAAEPDGNQSA